MAMTARRRTVRQRRTNRQENGTLNISRCITMLAFLLIMNLVSGLLITYIQDSWYLEVLWVEVGSHSWSDMSTHAAKSMPHFSIVGNVLGCSV